MACNGTALLLLYIGITEYASPDAATASFVKHTFTYVRRSKKIQTVVNAFKYKKIKAKVKCIST